MIVNCTYLSATHDCLLHMFLCYTCLSSTPRRRGTSNEAKNFKIYPEFSGDRNSSIGMRTPLRHMLLRRKIMILKFFFFVCIKMIFYNCLILIIAKLSLNFNFDKVREQTFLYWRWEGGLNWREGDKHFMFEMVQTWKKFKSFRRCVMSSINISAKKYIQFLHNKGRCQKHPEGGGTSFLGGYCPF